MSYKTELQSNNVDLQGILDKVNALPEMEEAPELPTLSNPAAAAQILSGYEVLDQHGIKLTGIMEDNGAVSQALNAGGSYTIPAGYHNGSGKVTGNSLSSQGAIVAELGLKKSAAFFPNGYTVSVPYKNKTSISAYTTNAFYQGVDGQLYVFFYDGEMIGFGRGYDDGKYVIAYLNGISLSSNTTINTSDIEIYEFV